MFETVAPSFSSRSRRIFYETLPISVAAHFLVVGAVLVNSVWNVNFPRESPKVMRAYNLTEIPDPPPPPPPPAAPKQQVVPQNVVVQNPDLIVEPTMIPETIPVVQQTLSHIVEGGVAGGVEGGIPGGVAGGTIDGVPGGDVGGKKGGIVGGLGEAPPPKDNIIHIERDRPLPMHPVSQVYPQYPEEARLRHYEGSLVVRYHIGTDGRVKEVIVLNPSERKMFDDAAVRAIRNWRFRPLIKDGQAAEVVHELTINFSLNG